MDFLPEWEHDNRLILDLAKYKRLSNFAYYFVNAMQEVCIQVSLIFKLE